ncbi:chromosomal replication initiator DnaA [Saccharibacter sp. 17.LH.SD]|nr:chromosomal replication initiator DnaA [Saccharibacter sp. 17.LH.SD]
MALDLQRESRFSASHFIPGGSNAAARHWLSRDAWPEGRLWIWGSAGTGKTHLLRAWAARHQALVVEADTLLCDEQGEIFAQGLPFHPIKGAVVLDHLDRLKNEVALLHILNRSQAEGVRVLMAARFPPARHHFALPDLASRLRATLTAVIDEPEDDLRATLILSLLAERQLVVAQPVTEWLWRHLPRTGEALVEAVKRLDAAALERGGPITRQLAQEVLSDMLSSASI